MSTRPLLSFIVLVHNYRNYVAETIRSILAQTVSDFEIVVVDDASTDDSADIVRSFSDPRIRLFVNENNLGGAGAYNRAISLARGEFLVNLDADDWIEPHKCERQLRAFEHDPSLDIVGSYISVIDAQGLPHKDAGSIAGHTNRPLDLNLIDTWIVQNILCRSSTMMRHTVHEKIGPDDATMYYTCDFELWTRALRYGLRFDVLREPLCQYRWHGKNITHANPSVQFLEICYLLARNIMPLIEARAQYPSMARLLSWLIEHEQFARLRPVERYRVFGNFFLPVPVENFSAFRAMVLNDPDNSALTIAGRRNFALFVSHP